MTMGVSTVNFVPIDEHCRLPLIGCHEYHEARLCAGFVAEDTVQWPPPLSPQRPALSKNALGPQLVAVEAGHVLPTGALGGCVLGKYVLVTHSPVGCV